MKYFSAFSGIGGFEIGIEHSYELRKLCPSYTSRGKEPGNSTRSARQRFNFSSHRFTCVGYSEIDKYALEIYNTHFPKHPYYGDITKIKTKNLPDFDLLVAGFPCQTFSIAGKRQGFEDARGSMFFELTRILRAKRPRLFLFENVKGLLSHDDGNTFKTIITTFTKLGYDTQWQVLNSADFGVPQNRERVFIVGHLRTTCRAKIFPIQTNCNEALIIPTLTTQTAKNSNGAFVSQTSPQKIKQIVSGSQGNRVYNTSGLSVTLASQGGGMGAKTGLYKTAKTCIRRLTPTECERLQGFPDGWTKGLSDTQRYKCLGNAVTVPVVTAIILRLCSL